MADAFSLLGNAPITDDTNYLTDEIQFDIDSNLRTIAIPTAGVVIGVTGDKNVNRVNFRMPAWYNGFDMSKFSPRINFIDPEGNVNYYTVTDMTVYNSDNEIVTGIPTTSDTIYFTWLVDSYATKYVGSVVFNVRFTKFNSTTNALEQAFNTTKATCTVLEGITLAGEISQDEQEDLLFHMTAELQDVTDGLELNIQQKGVATLAAIEAKGETTLESIPDDYSTLSSEVSDVKSDLSQTNDSVFSIINNDLFLNTTFINGFINDNNSYSETTLYKVSDYIKVKGGDVLKTGRIRFLCFYNSYKTFSKSDSRSCSSSAETEQTYTVPEDGYVRITVYASDYDNSSAYCLDNAENRNFFTEKSISEITEIHNNIPNYLYEIANTDLLAGTTFINGFINDQGIYADSNEYKVSDYIEVKSGQILKLGRARFLTAYDTYKGASPSRSRSYSSSAESEHEYTVTENGYVRITIYVSDYNNKTTYCLLNAENRNIFTERAIVDIKKVSNAVSSPILTGKKLVFCGDSFTEYTAIQGGSTIKTADNYDFDMGVYKTYPWWICKRNNFTLVNEARSGSTMTKTGSRNDAFSDTRYKNIPNDADYIIIKFGINDVNESATLGTISDNTNTTFFGAWNTVMSYLRANHPKAKIGIIITNGLGTHTDYADAEIAIAKKWGVGYLNEALGTDIPVFYRTSRTDVSSEVTNMLLEKYAINQRGGDTHPTVEWHEYESTIVENWIRGL